MLLMLIILAPVLPADRFGFVVELLFNLVLLAGVYSVGPTRQRTAFLLLTVATLAIRWGEELTGTGMLDVTAHSITVAWIAYAVAIIVSHLFQQRDVTLNTILGAIVTYLLIAIAFASLFQIIELQSPGSFSGLPDDPTRYRSDLSNTMIYFSFVCLTTMGYGDIVPVSDLARPVAVLEGVTGQLYLGVMIARLVGLHVARGPERR